MEIEAQSEVMLAVNKTCSKCHVPFDTPKLIQYYACPNCLSKIEEEQTTGCRHWFGYLNQKEKGEVVPNECVECARVIECMLIQATSPSAASEIQKWYF